MAARKAARWHQLILGLVLAASLALRLTALDVFITTDEPNWHDRSKRFYAALREGRWEDTVQSEHPGVITMWCGAIASPIAAWADDLTSLERWAPARRILTGENNPAGGDFPTLTLWSRRVVALFTWLGIVALFALLRRLFGRDVALVATALIALDPLFLMHSRFHHLDGILTTMMALSAVALLAGLDGSAGAQTGPRWRYIVLSGVTAGLAMANKAPALYLAPWTGLALALWAWFPRDEPARLWPGWPRVRRALVVGLAWGAVAAATILLVWPALWVHPVGTLRHVLAGAMRQGTSPHENLNYFMGQPVADPGWAFYPVAWALRTTPWAMLGIVAVVLTWRRPSHRREIASLLAFAICYGLMMTLSPKKFDRYLLPVFPATHIMAAFGLVGLAERVARRWPRWKRAATPALAAVLLVAGGLTLWPTRPYYSGAYNPLLGGTRTAPQALLIGWGEGLEQVARYVNHQPHPEHLHIASHSFTEFELFCREPTLTLLGYAHPVEPDYFLLYASKVQRRYVPHMVADLYGVETPAFTATKGGIEYAWLYDNPYYRDELTEVLARIAARDGGEALALWNVDAARRTAANTETPGVVMCGPVRDDFVLGSLQRAAEMSQTLWLIAIPEAEEALNALAAKHLARVAHETETVRIGEISARRYALAPGARFVPEAPRVSLPHRLGDGISLLGHDGLPERLEPGQTLSLRLYWRTTAAMETTYNVFLHLLAADGAMVVQGDAVPQGGGWPTSVWQPGETVIDDYTLTLPADAPQGPYTLAMGMYDPETMARLPITDAAGCPLPDDRIMVSLP